VASDHEQYARMIQDGRTRLASLRPSAQAKGEPDYGRMGFTMAWNAQDGLRAEVNQLMDEVEKAVG